MLLGVLVCLCEFVECLWRRVRLLLVMYLVHRRHGKPSSTVCVLWSLLGWCVLGVWSLWAAPFRTVSGLRPMTWE